MKYAYNFLSKNFGRYNMTKLFFFESFGTRSFFEGFPRGIFIFIQPFEKTAHNILLLLSFELATNIALWNA